MKSLQVYLSPLASFKLDKLLEYLEHEWGANSKNSFLKKFSDTVDQLSSFPRSSPESKVMEGIHRCVVTRQTSLYYRIHADSVEIITVSDNRQNPVKVSKEIKKYFGADD